MATFSYKWSVFLILGVLYAFLLSGCATGTVMRWTGPSEFEGRGGAVQTIDGIDFYMSGEPAGKFKVLSIIQGSYYRGGNILMSAMSEHKATKLIVKEAKAEGVDAAIVLLKQVSGFRQFHRRSGTGTVEGNATSFGQTTTFNGTENINYSSSTVVHGEQSGSIALVKYIDVERSTRRPDTPKV